MRVLVLILALGLAGCDGDRDGRSSSNDSPPTLPASGPTAPTGSPRPGQTESDREITLPPEPTFGEHCARCHGPEGAFYARPFRYQGDELRRVIEEMMIDKSGLDPTAADIDAMLEYHLNLRTAGDGSDL